MGGRGELVTPAAAAQMLMVSERTLRRMAARGELTTIPHGREVRYRMADVVRLAERNPATADAGQEPDPDSEGDVAPAGTTARPDTADTSAGETSVTAARADGGPLPTASAEATSSTDTTGESDQREQGGEPTEEGERRALVLAVETLGEELRAAREDTRRITEEAMAARRESGLWEGRARTLEERLRQLETLALASGEAAVNKQSSEHLAAESEGRVTEDKAEEQSFFARMLARWRRK